MPVITVLPNSSSVATPGWAYVADDGHDPSKAPIQQFEPRQRTLRYPVANSEAKTVTEKNAVTKHLTDLGRDNHRDVQISIPPQSKLRSGRDSRGRSTAGVRRILQSNKTFLNHLTDEEAQMSLQAQTRITQVLNHQTKSTYIDPKSSTPRGKRPQSAMSPRIPRPESKPSRGSSSSEEDHLLKTYGPLQPPPELIEEILSAPPLSYAAARSKPSSIGQSQRRFCEICGYWGRVKCLKCAVLVCGLDCKGVHDEQRCLKFYA